MILAQFKQTYGTGQSLTLVYPDDHGSSRVTVSSVGSTIQDKYSYDAWGNCTHTSGSDGSLSNFTGKFYDDTGFLYFNSRYYDPVTGRFITEDPSRRGVNWYAYCGNNPINMIDKKGLDTMPPDQDTAPNAGSGGEETIPDTEFTELLRLIEHRFGEPPEKPEMLPTKDPNAWFVSAIQEGPTPAVIPVTGQTPVTPGPFGDVTPKPDPFASSPASQPASTTQSTTGHPPHTQPAATPPVSSGERGYTPYKSL
jgi:RHS repeat-associated protein